EPGSRSLGGAAGEVPVLDLVEHRVEVVVGCVLAAEAPEAPAAHPGEDELRSVAEDRPRALPPGGVGADAAGEDGVASGAFDVELGRRFGVHMPLERAAAGIFPRRLLDATTALLHNCARRACSSAG